MKRRNRSEIWVALIVLAVGGVLTAILGLLMYISVTSTPLHPEPDGVPSMSRSAPAPEWAEAVERGRKIARTRLSAQNLPGVSVAVGAGGEIVWAEGFGWANLESRERVTPATRFRIGTASTVFTSAAVGLLLEKDLLRLDEKIQRYVPDFPESQWPVTLRHLMGHLAGLRSDGGDEGPLFSQHCQRPVDALPFFADRPLLFEPGTAYRHSRYGWIVVSAAVEAAADEPLYTFMRKAIFEPLQMADTKTDFATERATAYFPRFAAEPRYGPDPMREIDYSCYSGSSMFVSTPSDLVRFGLAINDSKLLRRATVDLLQASQRLSSGEQTGYGLGWDLENVTLAGAPARAVGHDGDSLGGMVASLMTFRDRGLVVAVTSNISYADTSALALNIAQAFAEAEPSPVQN